MIIFKNISQEPPYLIFKEEYLKALNANQKNIEALSIASLSIKKNEVDSRIVNLKFVEKEKFIFFSNYHSQKALDIESHNQISGLFFWSKTNVQIRIKAKIKKTSSRYNQNYFKSRSLKKNALAISSRQSEVISSYEKVIENYNQAYKDGNLSKCPDYWGGFSFVPYYFEFWEGHEYRINKRLVYKKIDQKWERAIMQP